MRKKPDITKTTTLARTRLFHVEALQLRFSNGVEAEFERLRSNGFGAVLVVPMLDPGTMLLIREYAAGVDRYELAYPKGRVEAGESINQAGLREIQEETGFGARRIARLRTVTLAPGYIGHQTHLLLAEDLYPSPRPGDEPETIEVVPWPVAEFDALLEREDFTEARSLLALHLVRDLLARRNGDV